VSKDTQSAEELNVESAQGIRVDQQNEHQEVHAPPFYAAAALLHARHPVTLKVLFHGKLSGF
jgi:hypothetical protein